MGWVFIFLGLITLGIASFMIYYGQHLLTHPEGPAQVLVKMPILSPPQEHLLELLARYQKQFTVDKLVISRKAGTLHFDNAPNKGAGISLLEDLYGMTVDDTKKSPEFERLMENMPSQYVRLYGEARFDNPFVVRVTENGMKYLRTK